MRLLLYALLHTEAIAVLELALVATSTVNVRKAYRRVSLSVHPDKVDHPRASEAFRKARALRTGPNPRVLLLHPPCPCPCRCDVPRPACPSTMICLSPTTPCRLCSPRYHRDERTRTC